MRQVDGNEPKLLDILGIPLDTSGRDFGHQPENRTILRGKWTCLGTVAVDDVLRFCEKSRFLLHTPADRVPEKTIADMSPSDRRSLQLIQVANARFYRRTSYKGKPQYRTSFTYSSKAYDIVVTDPIVEARLGKGQTLSKTCILTVSMGGPYEGNYFKFVAAAIELGD
jgi:hypothetical protein